MWKVPKEGTVGAKGRQLQGGPLCHEDHLELKAIKPSRSRNSPLPPPELPKFTLERRACNKDSY